jgi:hypothetical protein
MGMCDKYIINLSEFAKTQFTDPGARIDQYIIIEQKRGGVQITADSTAASQYS